MDWKRNGGRVMRYRAAKGLEKDSGKKCCVEIPEITATANLALPRTKIKPLLFF